MFLKKIIRSIRNQIFIHNNWRLKFLKEAFSKKKDKNHNMFEFLKKNIGKNNLVIFDVGAYTGSSVKNFNKYFNNKKTIHTFEPSKENFDILNNNFKSENIINNNFGLSDHVGKLKFFNYAKKDVCSFHEIDKNSKFYKLRQKEIFYEEFYINSEMVDVETLDSYCLKNKINIIDLIKIDTQGHEIKVLNGARNNLKEKKIIFLLIEVWLNDQVYKINKIKFYELLKFFDDYGYELVMTNKIIEKNSVIDCLFCLKNE